MGFCDDRVTAKKIIPDQLSCCLLDNIKYNCTTDNLSNCYDLGDSLTNPNSKSGFLVQCHTIRNINACVPREKNEPARDICDRKDSLYCLGGGAALEAVKQGLSSQILSAYNWALNRTLYQDSLSGIKACYNETEQTFKTCPNFADEQIYGLWNSTLDCKDFFQLGETNDCLLRDKKNIILPAFNMTIFKQVCKDPNWISSTTTAITSTVLTAIASVTPTENEGLSTSDKISLGTGIGLGVPGLILAMFGAWAAWLALSPEVRQKIKNKFSFTRKNPNQRTIESSSNIELTNREIQVQEGERDDELKEEQPSSIEDDDKISEL